MGNTRQSAATNIPPRARPCFISFSGIDGSGKTTQIAALLSQLQEVGLRTHVVRFWDDIAVFAHLRESMSHTIFKSERGIGTPAKPVRRRDKNIRTWYMSFVRLFLYSFDAIHLAWAIGVLS